MPVSPQGHKGRGASANFATCSLKKSGCVFQLARYYFTLNLFKNQPFTFLLKGEG